MQAYCISVIFWHKKNKKEEKLFNLQPHFYPMLFHNYSHSLFVIIVGRSREMFKQRTFPKVMLVVSNLPLLQCTRNQKEGRLTYIHWN